MADTRARWHHTEIVERLLAPAQELIALLVAFHFDGYVVLERGRVAEFVHHYRVVDHQVHRRQRVDHRRILTGCLDRLTHGSQVDDAGHAGEILH